MKQIDVEVSATISMKYDPESEEFKDSLEAYCKAINNDASEEGMLRHIAWHIATFGTKSMVYGVGYVSVNGEKKGNHEDWCGVDIQDGIDEDGVFDFLTAT